LEFYLEFLTAENPKMFADFVPMNGNPGEALPALGNFKGARYDVAALMKSNLSQTQK